MTIHLISIQMMFVRFLRDIVIFLMSYKAKATLLSLLLIMIVRKTYGIGLIAMTTYLGLDIALERLRKTLIVAQ
jgi:hypothetical protein